MAVCCCFSHQLLSIAKRGDVEGSTLKTVRSVNVFNQTLGDNNIPLAGPSNSEAPLNYRTSNMNKKYIIFIHSLIHSKSSVTGPQEYHMSLLTDMLLSDL